MKKLMIAAMLVAVAACAEKAPPADAGTTADTMMPAPAAAPADTMMPMDSMRDTMVTRDTAAQM